MKAKSASAKGKRFEKQVAALVTSLGLGLAKREIGSGNGQFKGDISWAIPRTPELKNQPAKFPKILIEWIEQSEAQDLSHQGWVLILRDPRKPESALQGFALLDMHDYLALEKIKMAPRSENPDRDLKYALNRLRNAAGEAVKHVEDNDARYAMIRLKDSVKDVISKLPNV